MAHQVRSGGKYLLQVVVSVGGVGGSYFLADVHEHSTYLLMEVIHGQFQDLVDLTAQCAFDGDPQLGGPVLEVRVVGAVRGFDEVPEHLVELAGDLERREHVLLHLWVGAPGGSVEEVLGDVLSGAEAVEDGAARKAPGAQPVVDGAGEVGGEVVTRCCGWLVEGEIR